MAIEYDKYEIEKDAKQWYEVFTLIKAKVTQALHVKHNDIFFLN